MTDVFAYGQQYCQRFGIKYRMLLQTHFDFSYQVQNAQVLLELLVSVFYKHNIFISEVEQPE